MSGEEKISFDPAWQEKYRDMIMTPAQAVLKVRPGHRVFIGSGCAEPEELVRSLTRRSAELADIEIVHLVTHGVAPYATREMADHFTVNSFFIGDNVREIIQAGYGHYTPIFLSDIPRLMKSGQLRVDVALIQVSPPDEKGFCSLGVSVDIVKSAAENAGLVIAQVNPKMPRTLGDSFIHVYDLDILAPVDEPVIEVKPLEVTDVMRQVGENLSSLIEDGSTIEVGIGRIPQSILLFLKDKKDLGIHSEMFTDTLLELIGSGAVTGALKAIDRGKIVASFCIGSRKLYDYVHNNPMFYFRPTEYVNDSSIIGQLHKMVAINTAMEVDLTGQVCADSIGTKFYSGIGGQVDFNRGAARSPGGKVIIALPSTAKGGSISRIVSRLSPGAGVVTTRGGVHYVVTEHGVAYLHGKNIHERAMALISVAHPDHRERLLKEAIELKYVRPEMSEVEGKIWLSPQELKTSCLLDDGTQVTFRSIRPTDEHATRDLFYALSQETIYYRYMTHLTRISHRQLQNFVYIDHRHDVAIVGTVPDPSGEEIIAVGRYYLDPKSNRAEVAFVVRDQWQNRGLGKFMLKYLVSVARRNGIRGFTAEVLRENKSMQSVFNKSGLKIKSGLNEGVYSFELDFA
ncbi:MAG: GNAT family N-acetyltransferase [Nitrospinae bacterium]|nr:GNAT family N-acetyltransferase [Nitrospinota bacterium]